MEGGTEVLTRRPASFFSTGLLPTGNLVIVADSVPYAYTVLTDNNNERTLQGFSQDANSRMRPGGNPQEPYFTTFQPFFTTFQPFFDYYGTFDYADQIVTAGFEGGNTNLVNGNVNLQSAGVGFDARDGKKWMLWRLQLSRGPTHSRVRLFLQRLFQRERPTCRWPCTSSEN